jgi:flagellar motility protein MotE (MotC chaperone)
MGIKTSFACVESRDRRDASWDVSTHTAAAGGVGAAVGGTLSLSSQQHAAEIVELRQRNHELRSQLTELRSELNKRKQLLEENKRNYETTLRNLQKEIAETRSNELDAESMVRLLRRAELNDAKIVPIINKLFPPPEGHKCWQKHLLPKED